MALGFASCVLAACSGSASGNQAATDDGSDWSMPAHPAFRGAIGYGSGSKGGRGGTVMRVTTLADSGRGSLRECIEARFPRVCVFRVSGTIRFTGKPPRIRHPFITIAGQTAPGDGITIAHGGGDSGLTPLVVKKAHDVVIRHIRVRNDRIGGSRGGEDSITIEDSNRVIIDHVSASWGRDEIINGHGENDQITVSNSIFAWGIPPHDKCALLGSDPGDPQRFSFIGNVCAHNGDRNPDLNFPPGSCVEVLNNVFYNAQSQFAEVWETYGGTPVTLMGNSFIAGPNTPVNAIGVDHQTIGSTGAASVYLADNIFDGSFQRLAPTLSSVTIDAPPCTMTLTPLDAAGALNAVLAGAGAFPRDSLDRQVVENIRQRGGTLATAPGTIPAPGATALPYPDRDHDGIDDLWETANGSNPDIPDPWQDADGNGETNLEQFLDDLHDRAMR